MNIVLIVVDTLRSKNLPIYGCDKDAAPFLTKMAEEHAYAENYYSNSPWTLPAHASIFTGELPHQHGTTTQSTTFKEDNNLLKKLKQSGYKTIGISENNVICPELGFDSDFDRFTTLPPQRNHFWEFLHKTSKKGWFYTFIKFCWLLWYCIRDRDIDSLYRGFNYLLEKAGLEKFSTRHYNYLGSEKRIERVKDILQKENQVFLFLNLMTVHDPYTFTQKEKEEFLESIPSHKIREITHHGMSKHLKGEELTEEEIRIREKSYDAAIRYTDRLIRDLWEEIPEDTVFVVASDHGELFGEYNFGTSLLGHHFGTFKELIEVPLIIFPENSIEFDQEKIYDHRSLHKIINKIANRDGDCSSLGKDQTTAEYYGRSGLRFVDAEHNPGPSDSNIPERFEDLLRRKSFSHISKEWKYDYATEGKHLWKTNTSTENNNLSDKKTDVVKEMREDLQKSLTRGLLKDIDI